MLVEINRSCFEEIQLMNKERKRQAEIELVAKCLAGERAAWEELADTFALAICICLAHCQRDRRDGRADLVEDAEHEVWCHLLATGAQMLERFDPNAGSLVPYLGLLIMRKVRDLERSEQRLHQRERLAAVEEAIERRDDVDWEELVREIGHLLRPVEQQTLEAAARGDVVEGDPDRKDVRLRQIASRVRRRLAEHGLGTPKHENGKNC
jgi:hypothetical protein